MKTQQLDQNPASRVFVQTDNPDGNTVVAYNRSGDGLLAKGRVYDTGGRGGILGGSIVDHVASQGSLAYDRARNLLYAANAGSNTITVFTVQNDELTRSQVISSGGRFPVSVAVHGDLVYVLNAREGGSLQGYRRIAGKLRRIHAWRRDLGIDPTKAPEFTHTPGQVAFTPDGSKLLVTTKASGNSINVYSVGRFGGLSADPVVNVDAGAIPFGVTFDAQGHLVVAEAGANAVATFIVNRNGTLTLVSRTPTGQAATCWVVRAGATLYASNAISGSLSSFRDNGNGTLTSIGDSITNAGTIDAAVSSDERFLYVQTGVNGIVDEFRINPDGSLASIGSVTVPGAVGGEGIIAS